MLERKKCSEAVLAYDNQRCFGQSISSMIETCKLMKNTIFDTNELSQLFNINKRRFFDIISVLDAIGCMRKISTNKVVWNGFGDCVNKEMELFKNFGVFDSSVPLSKLVFTDEGSSITDLTSQLLTFFVALNMKTLNLKDIANYICKDGSSTKKLLGKMYQITHILNSIGFISRTNVHSEIQINDKYFVSLEPSLYSIESLLNNKDCSPKSSNYFAQRRAEFHCLN